MRESPALDIIELLQNRGAEVAYHDRHVPQATMKHEGLDTPSATLDGVGDFDCVVIATDHSDVDYEKLVERAALVVDTRNATKDHRRGHGDKVVCL